MGFTAQPATQCSAYRPVKFKFETGSTTDLIEKLYVEVYNADDDSLIASYRKDYTSLDVDNYIFEFDVSGLAQSLLAPLPSAKTKIFADPDALNGYSESSSAALYLKARPEKRNTDNLLEAVGSLETSDTFYTFNLVQQQHEAQGLSDYIDAGERRVLHDPPANGIDIRVTDAFWLCCILNSAITRARYTLYNKDGTTSSHNVSLSWPSAATYSDKRVVFVGVGPRTANAYFTLSDDVARYTVFLADSSNTPLSETLTFNVLPRCAGREIRVHWMNQRGGADAYTFDAVKRRGIEVKSSAGEAPLPWTIGSTPLDQNSRGRFRTDTKRADSWAVETRIVPEDVAEWVAEMLDSPEAYIEQPTEVFYLPIIVNDGKVIYGDTEEHGAILKMGFALANDRFKPRN